MFKPVIELVYVIIYRSIWHHAKTKVGRKGYTYFPVQTPDAEMKWPLFLEAAEERNSRTRR